MVLYPNKLPESERVCSGICSKQYMDGQAATKSHFIKEVNVSCF